MITTDTTDIAALAKAHDLKVAKAQAAKAKKRKTLMKAGSGGYPYESWNQGCEPEDIPKRMEVLRAAGVPTEYNMRTGDPIIESPQHRIRHMQAIGLFDRNGTVSPKNR